MRRATPFPGAFPRRSVWSRHVYAASHDGMIPLMYGSRGVVPVAYALFAFLLGVTVGMLVRRVVPAMATTLALYVAVAAAMPLWLRGHLVPAVRETIPLNAGTIQGISISGSGGTMTVVGNEEIAGAWTIGNTTTTGAGTPFTGPADLTKCGPNGSPATCRDWLGSLGLQQHLVYHPAGHFWPLQWAESGVLVAATAALAAFCFWWIRHRVV